MEGKVDKICRDRRQNERLVRQAGSLFAAVSLQSLLAIWIRNNRSIKSTASLIIRYSGTRPVSHFITFNLVSFPKPQTGDLWWSACLQPRSPYDPEIIITVQLLIEFNLFLYYHHRSICDLLLLLLLPKSKFITIRSSGILLALNTTIVKQLNWSLCKCTLVTL